MGRHSYAIACSFLLAASACGPVSEGGTGEVEATSSALRYLYDDYYFDDCPDCSKNAATVGDRVVFDQLNMDGSNGKGITVIDERFCGQAVAEPEFKCERSIPVRVTVANNSLRVQRRVALPASSRYRVVYMDVPSADLVNRLMITVRSACGARFELLLQDATDTEYWARPHDPIRQYQFGYRQVDPCTASSGPGSTSAANSSDGYNSGSGDPSDLGAGTGSAESASDRVDGSLLSGPSNTGPAFAPVCEVPDAMVGPMSRKAIVYSGDDIDSDLKTVKNRAPDSDRWFALACNGTALAKLHFLRHTRRVAGEGQTEFDRQTLLKMLTADYCGDGLTMTSSRTPYTDNGHPLRYWDGAHELGRATFPGLDAAGWANVEAVWTPAGAICLNEPRKVRRDEVRCVARLRRCDESSTAAVMNSAHPVVSAHPRSFAPVVWQGPPVRIRTAPSP